MMYLWTFLLLAFAASSVHSESCSCPCVQQPGIDKATKTHATDNPIITTISLVVFPLDILAKAKVLVTDITEKVSGTASSIKISIKTPKCTRTPTGISLQLDIDLSCNEFSTTAKVTATAELKSSTENGCVKYTSANLAVSVTLTKTGKFFDPFADHICKLATPQINIYVDKYCASLVSALNEQSCQITKPCVSGDTEIKQTIERVTQTANGVTCEHCLTCGDKKICPTTLPPVPRKDNVNCVHQFGLDFIQQLCETVIGTVTEVSAAISETLATSLNILNKQLSCAVAAIDKPDVSFKNGKLAVQVKVKITIRDQNKKIIFSCSAKLNFALKVKTKHGCFGLEIDGDVNISETSDHTDDGVCGCKDNIIRKILQIIGHVVPSFTLNLNCILNCLFSLAPPIGGYVETFTTSWTDTGNCIIEATPNL